MRSNIFSPVGSSNFEQVPIIELIRDGSEKGIRIGLYEVRQRKHETDPLITAMILHGDENYQPAFKSECL
jgi:hypothetical protein